MPDTGAGKYDRQRLKTRLASDPEGLANLACAGSDSNVYAETGKPAGSDSDMCAETGKSAGSDSNMRAETGKSAGSDSNVCAETDHASKIGPTKFLAQ